MSKISDLPTALKHIIQTKPAYQELITLIPDSKEWRECATSIIIGLLEERKYIRWLLAGLFGLETATLGLLVKLILQA